MTISKKYLKIVGIILFFYILSRVDFNDIINVFRGVNLAYFSAALLFLAIGVLTRFWRWGTIIDSIGKKLAFKDLAGFSLKGIFWGAVTPGKLGEFLRAKYLSEATGASLGKSFYTTLIDRIADLLVIAMVGLLAVGAKNFQFAFLIFIFLSVSAYFLIKKRALLRALMVFIVPMELKNKIDNFLSELYQGFENFNWKLLARILAWAFLYYLFSGVLTNYFIALAIGAQVPFWHMFFITSLTWLAVALPVSFLGLGTREAAFIYLLSFVGVSAPQALAISLLALFSNILILTVPGAIINLWKN